MITVVDYDPTWRERFEALRTEYLSALSAAGVPVIGVEHVGSTSVPGLAAKPIIDIDIMVVEADVAAASDVLMSLGFHPLGELGIPQRWAFKEPAWLGGTNTYVVVTGSLSLRNHLAVRDTLRLDAELRAEYGTVKQQVAAVAANIDDYGQGKSRIVQRILVAAGLSDEERAHINGNQVPSHEELSR
ncbi:MAG: GrpB family protein [Marmoricola sp.]